MPKKEAIEDVIVSDIGAQGVATGVSPDAWTEVCNITIAPVGYGELMFQTRTQDVNIELPEKTVEFVPNLGGGRLTVFKPCGDATVSFSGIFVQGGTVGWPAAGTNTATTAGGMADLISAVDTAQPLTYAIDSVTRFMIRCTLLWTTETTLGNGAITAVSSKDALRMSFADGYVTSIKPSMTDDGLKWDVTMKFPATDKTGTSCCLVESCTTAGSLTALSAYSTTTKFR